MIWLHTRPQSRIDSVCQCAVLYDRTIYCFGCYVLSKAFLGSRDEINEPSLGSSLVIAEMEVSTQIFSQLDLTVGLVTGNLTD